MQKVHVKYFHRKPTLGQWSLEFIFEDVRSRLTKFINAGIHVSRFESRGFFRRVYNILEAPFFQGEINHITGDIHFVSFLLKKKKTILTILDCGTEKQNSQIKSLIYKFIWFYLPSRRVKYITAISEFTKSEIIRILPKISPAMIHVIPVAVSDAFIYYPKKFNYNCPGLLQIGTAQNKNLRRLISAIKDIDCTLTIVGKLNSDDLDLLNKNGIKYENHFGLPQKDLIELYKQCDILSYVSTFEGFGMPIIEANKVGRVVITGNCTSMPEVAGNAACIVDPFDVDSIRRGFMEIIKNSEYRSQLIENGLKNAKRFDGDLIAIQYLDLYRKTLQVV